MSCTDQDIGKLLGSYELGLLSEEERLLFENHLLECETCFQSLYQGAPITNLIREEKLAPSQSVELQDEKEKAPIRFFSRKWALAAASVLTVMIIAFVFVWVQGPWKKTERLRGHDDVSILVLSPVGEVTTLRELRWKPVVGVDSYDVKIYTEAGDLVWEGSAQGTKAVLPDSINESLNRGRPYFWQVEAVTERGESLKSQMVRFRIRN
jgi:hypothetical protein